MSLSSWIQKLENISNEQSRNIFDIIHMRSSNKKISDCIFRYCLLTIVYIFPHIVFASGYWPELGYIVLWWSVILISVIWYILFWVYRTFSAPIHSHDDWPKVGYTGSHVWFYRLLIILNGILYLPILLWSWFFILLYVIKIHPIVNSILALLFLYFCIKYFFLFLNKKITSIKRALTLLVWIIPLAITFLLLFNMVTNLSY